MGLFSCNTEEFLPLLKQLNSLNHAEETRESQTHTAWRCKVQPITPAEQQYFVAKYLAGKSTKQLQRESGRSRAAITTALKQEGVQLRTFPKASPEEITQMIHLYQTGLSLVRVAERVGYSEKTVWTQLRKAGIPLRSTHGG